MRVYYKDGTSRLFFKMAGCAKKLEAVESEIAFIEFAHYMVDVWKREKDIKKSDIDFINRINWKSNNPKEIHLIGTFATQVYKDFYNEYYNCVFNYNSMSYSVPTKDTIMTVYPFISDYIMVKIEKR